MSIQELLAKRRRKELLLSLADVVKHVNLNPKKAREDMRVKHCYVGKDVFDFNVSHRPSSKRK